MLLVSSTPVPSTAFGDHRTSRLSLWLEHDKGLSDGAWWPRSTSLQGEIPCLDLAVHRLTGARIVRAAYASERWAPAPPMLRTYLGMTQLDWSKAGFRPENISLTLTDDTTLVLTVIPPGTDPGLAEHLLAEHAHPHGRRGRDDPDRTGTRPPSQ